jgi:hypothetical protein
MKDLVLLVADKNAQFALKGALGRPEALGIHPIEFEFRAHPGRDGGARKTGPDMLVLERRRFRHGLLVFDFEGCGSNLPDAISVENELDQQLRRHWKGYAKTIVIQPELDVWVWGSDNAVAEAIDWPAGNPIRAWLQNQRFTFEANQKPTRPKEALETALKWLKSPRSSALYERIAERISLQRCTDDAFLRFRRQLTEWFPRHQ